jgi:hypothetical protein
MKSVGILFSLCVISYNANAQVSTEQRQWVEQALSEINHNTDTANMLCLILMSLAPLLVSP